METEPDIQTSRVSRIHIDLDERSLTVETADDRATRLIFTPTGVLYQLLNVAGVAAQPARGLPAQGEQAPTASDKSSEREPTTVVSGRLKTTPKIGEPDRAGNPTAWARLAAHQEGEQDAHMYSCTFHRHTAKIALSLQAGAQVTVEGYAHPSKREGRMDTFSVINILRYPGKPEKGTQ